MPAKPVKFTLPPDVLKLAAEQAAALSLTIDQYAEARFTRAVLDAAQNRTTRVDLSLARKTVEPRWKAKDKPKTKT